MNTAPTAPALEATDLVKTYLLRQGWFSPRA